MRKEKDYLGTLEIEENALFGIHSLRARMNFPDTTPFHTEWYQSAGTVKKACYQAAENFFKAAVKKYSDRLLPFAGADLSVMSALTDAAAMVEQGSHFESFIVPAVQGGAGTSINMNVNEIITNLALIRSGHRPGEYNFIDPVEHANIFQSTNDVVPTSLRIAAMRLLNQLEAAINELRQGIEREEKKAGNMLRLGYTQMQEAVPSSYGRLFSTYNDALSRDWWRVSKCFERIKVVNIGGSAIGTGITVPRFFMSEVVLILQQNTGLPVTRAENLQDATANLDSLAEVHAILKAHAINIEKIVSDLRILASDLLKNKELLLPQKQVGSSIMPAKVNPVIAEFVISVSHKVYSNDMLIGNLCGQGCLDLNAYLPLIGHALLESLKLLIAADHSLRRNMIDGLVLKSDVSLRNLMISPSVTTALLPYIGYNKASELAKEMRDKGIGIEEANENLRIIDREKLRKILEPSSLLKEGFVLKDLLEGNE
jgi:aspartate ammonia-lyase